MTEEEKDAYIKKLVQSNIDQQNKIAALSKKVYDLQKENAELKKKKEEIEIMTNFCKVCKKMHIEQLTKAKELLKKFIETSNPIYFEEDRQKVKAEAEQFLKD